MNYSKTEIEDAIIKTLMPLHMDNGGVFRKIAGYQGELDEENLTQFIITFPVILIAFGRSTYREFAWPFLKEEMTFAFVIGDRSMRENADARKGSSERTGTYSLMKSVRQKLHASKLGLNINKCAISGEVALANTRTLSLYSQEYKIEQDIREAAT